MRALRCRYIDGRCRSTNGCHDLQRCLAPPSETNEVLAEVWQAEFIRNGLCMLCGNSGIIDTIARVRGPRQQVCGGRAHCICPNGRRRKEIQVGDIIR